MTYTGPFQTPPKELLDGAIGWRHVSRDAGPGRWEPDGFTIVYPTHILTTDHAGTPCRDQALWEPA